jgi:hypothetical protein
MYVISDDVLTLLDGSCRQGVEINVTATDGATATITEADIPESGLTIDRYSVSGSSLEVGSAIAAELTLKVTNSDGKWDDFKFEGAVLDVKIRIYDSDSKTIKAKIPQGIFVIDTTPRTRGTVRITALDQMILFDKEAESITLPSTVSNLVSQCCKACGVTLSTTESFLNSYPNATYTVSELPESAGTVTYRSFIQWCAFLMGKCAYIDYTGALCFSWYTSPGFNIALNRRYTSDIYENDVTIDGISYSHTNSKTYKVGTCSYPISYSGCSVAADDDVESLLSNIYSAVKGTKYRPFEMTCKAYPHVWPMDGIYITDTNSKQYASVVTHVTYTMNASTAIKAEGLTATSSSYYSSNSFTDNQLSTINKILQSYSFDTSSVLEAARKEASEALNAGGTNGIMSYGPNELTITDTGNIETANRVFKLNLNGLGYSSDGANGTYDTVITADGLIAGSRIVAGSITSEALNVSVSETIRTSILNSVSETYETIENVSSKFSVVDGQLESVQEKLKTTITKTDLDSSLDNYYTKTDLYQKSEIDQKISDITLRVESAESTVSGVYGVKTWTTYYLRSNSATKPTTSTSGWSTTYTAPTADNQYAWAYDVITYTNGNTYTTTVRLTAKYGVNGTDGTNGTNGISITNVEVQYFQSSSKTSTPSTTSSSWSTTAPSYNSSKPYVWTRNKITYSDGTVSYTTPYYDESVDGKIDQAKAEIKITTDSITSDVNTLKSEVGTIYGVSSWTTYYMRNNSATKPNTTNTAWSTSYTAPTSDYQYAWAYDVITYTNGNSYTTAVRLTAKYGANGANGTNGTDGDDGVSVTNVEIQYFQSSSKTTTPSTTSSSWTTTAPTYSSTKPYVWTRNKITYSDGTTSTTTPYYDSSMDSRVTNCESKITQLSDSITSYVKKDDFSTLVEQNSESIRISWNKISSYIKFENAKLNIYSSSDSTNPIMSLGSNGMHFYRDGNDVGWIGTNSSSSDSTVRGLTFDLESAGSYMAWASKTSSSATNYTIRLVYYNKAVTLSDKSYDANTFYFDSAVNLNGTAVFNKKVTHNATLDMEGHYIYDPYFSITKNGTSYTSSTLTDSDGNVGTVKLYNADGTRYWSVNVVNGIIC